jgi:hypothetical protein
MSTSLLYHAWGIVGYQYRSTEYTQGKGIRSGGSHETDMA